MGSNSKSKHKSSYWFNSTSAMIVTSFAFFTGLMNGFIIAFLQLFPVIAVWLGIMDLNGSNTTNLTLMIYILFIFTYLYDKFILDRND